MMCRCSALPGWDNSRARVCESSLKSGWPRSTPCQATVGLAAAGRSAPDDDQVGASKGDPLPFGQVAPAKDVLPVGVDGDLDRLG